MWSSVDNVCDNFFQLVPIIGSNTVTYSNYRHVTVRRVGYARVQPPLLCNVGVRYLTTYLYKPAVADSKGGGSGAAPLLASNFVQ